MRRRQKKAIADDSAQPTTAVFSWGQPTKCVSGLRIVPGCEIELAAR